MTNYNANKDRYLVVLFIAQQLLTLATPTVKTNSFTYSVWVSFSEPRCTPKALPIAEPHTEPESAHKVIKKGKISDVTFGYITDFNFSFKWKKLHQKEQIIILPQCYRIARQKADKPFMLKGDSGCGVFLIDEQERILKPLGIGFGIFKTHAIVCKIKHVLDNFNLAIYQDAFSGEHAFSREQTMTVLYDRNGESTDTE